jgi:SAM-dependent methyltransferase
MKPTAIIDNELRRDETGVWVRPDAEPFAYTDGLQSEAYLEEVLTAASDLSTGSLELASRIKDWPSEYHLTPARAQLLEGFVYDRSHRVLEVGCGCGAITRFLGETFAEVTAIEGSHARARLARMRTRDLDNVAIVNSPFQEIRFKTRFDMIFCIGVFEYATMFVEGEDPHRKILDYFSGLLAPGGVLVLAIENKLGLKYFASSAEDHSGILYDGIEGYPRHRKGARTFGRRELHDRLREHFPRVDFYYPWPDYKIPSCVISEDLIDRVDVAELVGSFRSRDYGERRRSPLFSEALAWGEIAANGLVPEFAHSFLAVASKSEQASIHLQALGVLYNRQRRPEFATRTTFEEGPGGSLRSVKKRVAGDASHSEGNIRHQECADDWIDGPSLQATMMRRARAHALDLAAILEPSRVWFDELRSSADDAASPRVPGERLDSIWRNCFVVDSACRYIDGEWSWTESLPLDLVVARGLYYFAQSLRGARELNPGISRMRVGELISAAGKVYGLAFDAAGLDRLARFESAFLDQVTGDSGSRYQDVRAVLARRIGQRPRMVPPRLRRILRGIRRRLKP